MVEVFRWLLYFFSRSGACSLLLACRCNLQTFQRKGHQPVKRMLLYRANWFTWSHSRKGAASGNSAAASAIQITFVCERTSNRPVKWAKNGTGGGCILGSHHSHHHRLDFSVPLPSMLMQRLLAHPETPAPAKSSLNRHIPPGSTVIEYVAFQNGHLALCSVMLRWCTAGQGTG